MTEHAPHPAAPSPAAPRRFRPGPWLLTLALVACDTPTSEIAIAAEEGACRSGLDEDLDGRADIRDVDCWGADTVTARACSIVAGTGSEGAPVSLLADAGAWRGDFTLFEEDPLDELDGPVLEVPAGGAAWLDVRFTGAVPGTRLVGVLAEGTPTTRVGLVAVDEGGPEPPTFVEVVLEPTRIAYPAPGDLRADQPGVPRVPPAPGPRPFALEIGATIVAVRRADEPLGTSLTFTRRDDDGFRDLDDLAELRVTVDVAAGERPARLAGLALHRPPGPRCPGVDEPPLTSPDRPGAVVTLATDGRVTCALVDRGGGVLEPWRSLDGGRRYVAGAATGLPAEVRGVALAPRCDGGFEGLAWLAGGAGDGDAWVPLSSDDCTAVEAGAPRATPDAPGEPSYPGLSAARPVIDVCDDAAPLRVTVPHVCEGSPAVADFALRGEVLEPVADCQLLEAAAEIEAFLENPGVDPRPPFTGAPLQSPYAAGARLFVGLSGRTEGTVALWREVSPAEDARLRAAFRSAGAGSAEVYAGRRGGRAFGATTRLLVPVLDPWLGPSGRAGTVDERGTADARVAFGPLPATAGPFAGAPDQIPWGATLYLGATPCPDCASEWAAGLLSFEP